ncbi:MAG: glycosyltransferase family 2 protein [Rhodocyclaceae bacterium]|nr:glycosyltransferase family 2 protein [Rhodocyclaceae bacterium]
MINIVIPMAGLGSRFVVAGYEKPKPFIDVDGKPMIVRVLENLAYPGAKYILIGRREHLDKEVDLVENIKCTYGATFVVAEELTAGTPCTILLAEKLIDSAAPVLIANSDQLVDIEIADFIDDCTLRKLDGSILTFLDKFRDPKWSFAKVGDNQLVDEVKEKQVISDIATVGIYLFSNGSNFIAAAKDMIAADDRVNNEFYTCPIYNYLIRDGGRIGVYNIDFEQMHGLGVPADLEAYLAWRRAGSQAQSSLA